MRVFLLRHVSGAGSSTLANYLASLEPKAVICSADDYYYDKYGSYKWNRNEIGTAHRWCQTKYTKALLEKVPLVIVSNTLTTEMELKFYVDYACQNGYQVVSLVVENRHGGKNIHSVPEETISTQEFRLLNNLKLR